MNQPSGSDPSSEPTIDRASPAEAEATAPAAPAPVQTGSSIGPYRVLDRLGEGGMGVVYLAQQETPVRRRVALKIIKPGMDSEQVIARFEAERQALALMDHPHIARVLDCGADPSGRPYFVMELVRGLPITTYCDQNKLDTRERLDLFVPVCQAIQHAHQKGIIHRDVKPSNILVTEYDGKRVAKVIDFGVARAVDHRLTDRTLYTQMGAVVGTFEYMSPEQADPAARDVDTRADVYSLGVVLYELLTSSTPLDRARLRKSAYAEILRRIREEEPPRPSTRVTQSRENLAAISQQRRTDPARLRKLLRGDLDWVVMKAIEKDRSRRYDSAGSLAKELERYLAQEPVEAGPPTASYRLRKLAGKYRTALVTAAAFAAILITGSVLLALLSVREYHARQRATELATVAERARYRAERAEREARLKQVESDAAAADSRAVLEFFENRVLAAARPREQDGGLGIETTIRQAVDAAVPQVARSFADRPLVQAAIRRAIGITYEHIGDLPAAISQLEQSFELRRARLGPDDPLTLESMTDLAYVLSEGGDASRAVELAREALSRLRASLREDHPRIPGAQDVLATALVAAGKFADSVPIFESALEHSRLIAGLSSPETISIMGNLANALERTGRTDEAITLQEQTLKLSRQVFGSGHPSTLTAINNLSWFYRNKGRFAESLPLVQESLALRTERLGPEHPHTLFSMNDLALAYADARQFDRAIPLFEEVLKLRTRVHGERHQYTLYTMNDLGEAYLASGRGDPARTLLKRAYAASQEALGPDHHDTLNCGRNLARALLEVDPVAAEQTIRPIYEIRRKKAPRSWLVFDAESLLGASLARQKRLAEARPLLQEAARELEAQNSKIVPLYKSRITEAQERLRALSAAQATRGNSGK